MVHGLNFRLNLEGEWKKLGFYTTRFADATDPVLAEDAVLEQFRQSSKCLDLMAAALNSDDDPPIINAEDVEEVEERTGVGEQLHGLAFYNESDKENAEPDAPPNAGGADAPPASVS